ncbi:MAG: class I SAM-dependent methyltransferase [Bacteroidota bacterium]
MDQIEDRLRRLFEAKYGSSVGQMSWSPRLRHRFGYFTPDDYYEAVVEGLVESGTEWLDVGGGSSIFPNNPKLARILADRCKRLVAIDPSANVNENPFAHERCQMFLEDFQGTRQFSLATARMVVEHVARPESFVAKLGQLIRPGGRAVVYTVSRWAPMTILSHGTPIGIHNLFKRVLWGAEEKDTFPVVYRMNTRRRLQELFASGGFREVQFFRLDDCRTLAKWKVTSLFELSTWRVLRSAGIGYPESCLLGVYERVGP